MTEIYPPTRAQFQEFLPNYEMIRRFELLFRIVGEDLFELIANTSEGAQATANSALALIEALKQDTNVNQAALEAKSNYAIDLAESNANNLIELEFLMQAVCIH